MFAIINENVTNSINWLEQYGNYLFAFACSRLHNEAIAEDLVQETLLAALESEHKFSNRSSEKTWLTAILKNKIIDYYRLASRQVSFTSDDEQTDFFDESGAWRDTLTNWNISPESLLEHREFQNVLMECLAELPKNLSTVFTLREIEGLETDEICEILNLTPNNLWVLLHRARLRLRQTIDERWFGKKSVKCLQTSEFVFCN